MALSVGACGRDDKAEIRSRDALALAPNEGVIVGVMVVAETPETPPDTGVGSDDLYLTFLHTNRLDPHELPLRRPGWTSSRPEQGAMVYVKPFAFRLEAGSGRFSAIRVHRSELKTTYQRQNVYDMIGKRWEWRDVPSSESIDHSINQFLSAAGFTVTPGRVTYIGRVGVLFHVTTYGTPAERDKACLPHYRHEALRGPRCILWQLLVGDEPDADLPSIRQAFPNLPAGAIELRPLTVEGRSWMLLPQALQSIRSR